MSFRKQLPWLLFGLYCLGMLYLLFFQRMGWHRDMAYSQWLHQAVNFVPFRTVAEFAQMAKENTASGGYLFTLAVKNLGGNVFLFVPSGIFLPILFQRQKCFWVFLGTVALTIVLVELLQLLTMLGSCDIDDLILNVLGAACGFGLWKCAVVIRAYRKTE
ncbi:MAG: VanZ family protein [Ruminococcus sp.]